MAERIALYGKHPKQKYYRLVTVCLDGSALARHARKLKEARAIELWFTKRFKPGEDIPDRYARVPLKKSRKGGR